jgi:hypothetical protein
MHAVLDPAFGRGDDALVQVSCNNPIELIDRTRLRNGELQMYVAYGAKDELNIDAQVESFLYLAKFRQLYVGVGYDPHGHHDMKTAYRLFPDIVTWLAPRLAPYAPGACATQLCARPAPVQQGYPVQPVPPHVAQKQAPTSEKQAPVSSWRAREPRVDDRNWEPAPPPRDPAPPADRRDLGPYAGPPVAGSPFAGSPFAGPPLPPVPAPLPSAPADAQPRSETPGRWRSLFSLR